MRKYLSKILFFFVFFCILLIINKFRYTYYYPVPEYEIKLKDFEEKKANNETYNTVLWGSSHIYRQINPILFDKINTHNGIKTKTYNFGIQGCFSLEQLYLLEDFLSSASSQNIKNVLIELQLPFKIAPENTTSKRGHYYVNFKTLLRLLKIRGISNLELLASYIKSALLNLLNYQSSFYYNTKNNSYEIKHSLKRNGYIPYSKNKYLKPRRKKFTDDPKKAITKSKKKSIKKINFLVESYFEILYTLQTNFSHVNFYIVCHPFNSAIKDKNFKNLKILCLRDNAWLNLIEETNNYFDIGHLSSDGAYNFTIGISKLYLESNSKNKFKLPEKVTRRLKNKYYPKLKAAIGLNQNQLDFIRSISINYAKKINKIPKSNKEKIKELNWEKQTKLKSFLGFELYNKKLKFDRGSL